VRFVYLVSYFQNPTGISVSPRRRREIFDLVQRFGADNGMLLIEDAAYRELRYDVDDVSSIRALDEDGETVVYLGTFSKSFSPGLKTGYGLFPKTLAEHVVNLKGAHDFGSGNFAQHVLERVLRGGRYDRHVERLRRSYRRRRDVMVQTLDETMPAGVVRTDPQGGLYVWLTLPEGVETGSDAPLFEASLARGMLYVPGEFCFAATSAGGEVPRNCLRLSFGVGALDAIAEGVKRLAAAVREVMDSTRTGAT